MTLRHLNIFTEVCKDGSVTKAGERLFLAQPSVSLAVRELEDYYGVKLFDRINKRLHITECGKTLLEYASHILSSFSELEQKLKSWDRQGVLRIGASVTVGNYLFPKLLGKYMEVCPEVEVRSVVNNSHTIEDMILKNSLDIAVIEGNVHSDLIIQRPFMDDGLVLICGKSHPFSQRTEISVKEILHQKFIAREKGSAGREFLESILLLNNITVNIVMESVSTQAIIKAVSMNTGLAVVPYLLVRGEIEAGTVCFVKVKGIDLKRKFSVIYHKNKYLTGFVNQFLELLENTDSIV